MEVIATDQGVPRKSDSANVEISVLRNEHSPVFGETQYTRDISEKIGYSDVILTVSATDDDSEKQPDVSTRCLQSMIKDGAKN